MHLLEVMNGQADLFEMVGALSPPGGLTTLLHCGQQQCDQDAMIAITTSNSIKVKPVGCRFIGRISSMNPMSGSGWSACSWTLSAMGQTARQARPGLYRPRYGFVRGGRANECIAKRRSVCGQRSIERSSGRSRTRNGRVHNDSRKRGGVWTAPTSGSSEQRRSAKTKPSRERARLGNARRAFDASCVVPGICDREIDWLIDRIRVVPAA